MQNIAKTYLATQVETTSQGELVVLLYEAAIKFLKQAKVEIQAKNYARKGVLITRAMNVVHELAESLNPEKGGDLAKNLSGIYHFCTMRLVKANLDMNASMLEEVIAILDGLRSAFAQIVPQQQAAVRAASAAAPQPAAPLPEAEPRTYPPSAAVRPAPAPTEPTPPPACPANPARLRAANAYLNSR
jgi:flagellar protein FliS